MPSIIPTNQDKLKVLFKENYFILGCFFFCIGSILFIIFSSNSDFKSLYYSENNLNNLKGVVTTITETDFSFNDNKILKYEYHFLVNNKTQNGISYSSESSIQTNNIVNVKYVSKNPAISESME